VIQFTDRITALARALKSSAEQARDDSTLQLLRSISMVLEVPNPLRQVQGSSLDDTNVIRVSSNRAGAFGAGTTDSNFFAPGMWHLRGYARHQFSGTTNIASISSYSLVDPAGLLFPLADFVNFTGSNLIVPIDQVIVLLDPTWFVRQSLPAQIAGDSSTVALALLCSRLL